MTIRSYISCFAFVGFLSRHTEAFLTVRRPDLPGLSSASKAAATTNTATRLSAENMSDTERKPWELFRFLQQSSKFVQPPPLIGRRRSTTIVQPGDTLWQAGSPAGSDSFTMAPLDDVVMGGASASQFDDATGIWSGTVTTANSGGFVGLRSTPAGLALDCRACRGLQWRVKNPSNRKIRFKFVLRDSTDFNGITWTTSVDVKPGVSTVKIPFDKQVPALFARVISDATPFDKSSVQAVQVAYSKFEYDGGLNPTFATGPVKLQLLELSSF